MTKTNEFARNERFNRFSTDQGTNRFTANTATNSFTNTITSAKILVNRRKTTGLLQLIIRTDLQNVLVLTGVLLELTDLVTTMCFT